MWNLKEKVRGKCVFICYYDLFFFKVKGKSIDFEVKKN